MSVVVVLRCRKAVSVDAVTVAFHGAEAWSEPQKEFLKLSAELGAQDLPEGETRLPFRFLIPDGNPPSFQGNAGAIRYGASVHVDIPWWPDRWSQFTIHVAQATRPEPVDSPQRYSTKPSGPEGSEPHAELSLTSLWARPGDTISGAFALSNTAYNGYGAATLRLASTEVCHFGFRQQIPGLTFSSRIEDTAHGEATMIPFRMSVPKTATPGFDETRPTSVGLVSLKWEFVLEVEVRRGKNLVMRIPFEVLPHDAEASVRPYQAPPVVGSNRTGELWQSVGQTHGFEMKGGELHKELGQVQVVVRPEHQGKEGVFLHAGFRFPSLGLGLELERAGKIRRVIGGGVSMGQDAFDANYFVQSRDEEQTRASLKEALCVEDLALTTGDAELDEMNDETCVLRLADNGHSPEVLGQILLEANMALSTLHGLAGKVTPPTGVDAATVKEWEHLRARLGADLCLGSLKITGEQGSVQVEVVTLFGNNGRPEATELRIVPNTPLEVSPFELTTVSEADAILSTFKGEIGQRLIAALSGGTYFRLDPNELVLDFAGPLGVTPPAGDGLLSDAKALDAASALQRIGHLVRVVGLLGGESGPYR